MLRLTTTVIQTLTDATVHVSVHQEDPYDGSSSELGAVSQTYDTTGLRDRYDELTTLLAVLYRWAGQTISRHLDEALAHNAENHWD